MGKRNTRRRNTRRRNTRRRTNKSKNIYQRGGGNKLDAEWKEIGLFQWAVTVNHILGQLNRLHGENLGMSPENIKAITSNPFITQTEPFVP